MFSAMHLIHLEDSEPDAELIADLVLSQWPDCRITRVATREAFETAVRAEKIDVILSDYTIPGYDALLALATARALCPRTPFIFFSGTIGEERATEALKAGATDYVLKDRPARIIPAIRNAIAAAEQDAYRRQAEERLREQASLIEKANDAIFVTDMERRLTSWNAGAERT